MRWRAASGRCGARGDQARSRAQPHEPGLDREIPEDAERPRVDRRLVGRRRQARVVRQRADDRGEPEEEHEHQPDADTSPQGAPGSSERKPS